MSKDDSLLSKASELKNQKDQLRLIVNRHRYEGFRIGHYLQTPPMLFTRDGHNLFLGDMYRGSSAFLICSGPSANDLDLSLLQTPGILTMGINNSVRTFRPNMWTSVDEPESFIKSIWLDPTIMKFVPYDYVESKLFDSTTWKMTELKVGQCPNVSYYRRNENFNSKRFLFEDTFNWGNHTNLCQCGFWRPEPKKDEKKIVTCPKCNKRRFGSRSVFLPALRLLYFLGVRSVFLIGCDFRMNNKKSNYSFKQSRSNSSVVNNNSTYEMLSERMEELKPIFEAMGFQVFNCNPKSKLDIFPIVSFEDAVSAATAHMPMVEKERTAGLYERKKSKK